MSANERSLVLRPAARTDADALLRWRNDPTTRAHSFDTGEVTAAEHEAWLEAKLASPDTRIYIAERDGEAVGQIRVDRSEDARGVVSVAVDAARRGTGLGRELIRLGTERAAAELGLTEVDAFAKPENEASLRAFRAAGYEENGVRDVGGKTAIVATWRSPRAR
jgi:RimJ/RimL family protein N-acetyltransferase